ncbi:MAG: autotransporter-associated beta strand repeat-containing protein [Tepidisphaeraceae bacterium]
MGEQVGISGTGTFTQTGGTHTVTGTFVDGGNSGGTGTYNFSGGTLTIADEYVGYDGIGTFIQTGGTNTITGSTGGLFRVGRDPGSQGYYTLSDGILNANAEQVGVSGTGTFTQTGGTNTVTGTLTVAANAGSAGTYNLQGGSLTATAIIVNEGGVFTEAGGNLAVTTLTVSGGTFNLAGVSQQVSSLSDGGVTTGAITDSSDTPATLTVNQTINPIFGGVISGNLALTKSGTGTLALTGANTYTGATTINAGTPNFASGSLGSSSIVFNGGTLQWASGNTQDISGQIAPLATGQTAILDTNGNTVTFASPISGAGGFLTGAGGLTKQGAGTLILTSTNTYIGATTISAGILQLRDGAPFDDGSIASTKIVDNASLVFDTFGSQNPSAVISGSGSLSKLGTGTLLLTQAEKYKGTTFIGSGIVQLGVANALPKTTLLTVTGSVLAHLPALSSEELPNYLPDLWKRDLMAEQRAALNAHQASLGRGVVK